MTEREERLETALRWYADPRNYDEDGTPGEWLTYHNGFEPDEYDFDRDDGARACEALGVPSTSERVEALMAWMRDEEKITTPIDTRFCDWDHAHARGRILEGRFMALHPDWPPLPWDSAVRFLYSGYPASLPDPILPPYEGAVTP